jgi:hypothetical protein
MYADDLVLMSESAQGLQKCIENLGTYCSQWKLEINIKKTKIMTFNKQGKSIKKVKYTHNGVEIEICNEYSYLGIIFKPSGNFDAALKNLTDKASKALFSIQTCLSNCQVETALHIFNTLVMPILNYGCEVMSSKFIEKLTETNLFKICEKYLPDKVQLRFAKHTLGLSPKGSNAATRGELGLYPMLILQLKYILKYWNRIRGMCDTSLVKNALLQCESLHRAHCPNWINSIYNAKALFTPDVNMSISFEHNTHYINRMVDKAKEAYKTEWQIIISNNPQSNKLRCYNTFKSEFVYEDYLSKIPLRKLRKEFTKLRVSNHSLQIEVGRYHKPKKIPAHERFCLICKELKVENEAHFLLDCVKYNGLREVCFNTISNVMPAFIYMSPEDQVVFMMRAGNGQSDIALCITSFINNCFELRKELV